MAVVLLACLGAAVVLSFLQSRLVYHPRRPIEETPAAYGLAYEDVSLTTADNVSLHGWWVPADRSRGTMLFFHGNAGNISHRTETLEIFNRLGMNSLIIDYRGYGRSGGKPSEAGTARDADAAWDYLVNDRQIDPQRIVIFGRSLGGAVAIELATRKPCQALIAESTFTSIPDMSKAILPIFPRFLVRFGYRSIDRIASVGCPVLVVHSPDDDLVPYEFGRELYKAAVEPKAFLEIKGSHNEGFLLSLEAYLAGMDAFLSELLGPAEGAPLSGS